MGAIPGECSAQGRPDQMTSRPTSRSNSVGQNDPPGAGRLRLDELELSVTLDARERRLATAQDDRVNDEPEFVNEALVHETRHKRRASNDVDRPTRLVLERPKLADITQEVCALRIDVIEGRGEDEVRGSSSPVRVLDLTFRWLTPQHRRATLRISGDRPPQLFIAWVGSASDHSRVGIGDQTEGITP